MENINYFDIIVIALILMLGLKGLLRGFIAEAFALIGIVAGVYLASRNANMVGEFISSNLIPMEGENTIVLVGFIITLVAVWIILYALGLIISKIFSASGLGIFDRFLGFAFGAGKVFFIFSIIIFAISQMKIIDTKLKEATKGSIVYPLLKEAGEFIIQIDPKKVQNNITQNINDIKKESKEIINSISSHSNTSKK